MPKFTTVDYFGYDLTPQQRMNAIKTAGFDGVILLWADYFDADYRDFPKYAEKAGLFVENTHAPYMRANSIWKDGPEGEEYTADLIRCVEDCRVYGIPTLVVHPINGITELLPQSQTAVGIERFGRVLESAEKHGVNIAIENQGSPEYLELVFGNIESDRLRFCFDSGHELYFSPNLDLLDMYGDKLSALHLHDNDGTEDAHVLPFDGNVDWRGFYQRICDINYRGAIALEAQNRGYKEISDPVEFLSLALSRAHNILHC